MATISQLEKLLGKLAKDELLRIVIELAAQDKGLASSLWLKYDSGNPSKQLKATKQLIKSIARKHSGRERFIPRRGAHSFACELLEVLDEAHQKSPDLFLETAILVLEEGIAAFQYADDSDGDIGLIIDRTMLLVKEQIESLEDAGESERTALFDRLIQVNQRNIFEGWSDFQIAWLHLCAEFGDIPALRERLREVVELEMVSLQDKAETTYTQEALLGILYRLLVEHGEATEAEEFVRQHLAWTSFRARAIADALEKREYAYALRLAEEGEQKDQGYPGLVSKWRLAKYEAYKGLHRIEEQRQLARELLLKGNYEFYAELEQLHEGDKVELYREILSELKAARHWYATQTYLLLIEDKQDFPEMLAYVKSRPASIVDYAERLSGAYLQEVNEIYRVFILSTAQSSMNRKQYRGVCRLLKHYGKIVGRQNMQQLVEQLTRQYNKRPALLDELRAL